MEDLSKDMVLGKPISSKMRAMLDKEKKEARSRIIERGIVHFRADNEFMIALLDAAEQSKIAPGTLCRRIVWEYLKSSRGISSCDQNQAELPLAGTADLAALARELKTGQEKIQVELKEIQSQLFGTRKKAK
jgi:hypothetical protein